MKTLITIKEVEEKQVVNARELHQFLEVGRDFSNWIKGRINQYGFTENEDFEVFAQIGEKLQNGRPSKEYSISLDMAKELSMVERNEKGKQARRYFIECEKQMRRESFNSLSSATNFIALPLKPIAEKRKTMQKELMEVVKVNLNRGDLKRLSEEEGISYNRIRNVIATKCFDYDIIYMLYEKARENIMFLDTEIGSIKEDLKSLSA